MIDALQMREVHMRALAVTHLRAFTNENFRFRPDGAPEARKMAADRWLEWWRENEKDLEELSKAAMREGNDETPERRKARKLWQAASLACSNEDIKFAEKLLTEALEVDPRFLRASRVPRGLPALPSDPIPDDRRPQRLVGNRLRAV